MREQIVVTVFPDGHSEARTIGMHGAKCLDAVPLIESLLDSTTAASSYTDDFYRSQAGLSQSTVQEKLDG